MPRRAASSPVGISALAPSSAWLSILKAKWWPRCAARTDLWTEGGVSELNLMQLEGQARATTRAMAGKLKELGRLHDWIAGGISATHHTSGRIDRAFTQVRRAICWNDHSLLEYHAIGLERIGGPERVKQLIGGPWAVRYSLSHLVKDEVVSES